jgi:hypothetical protein
MNTKKYQNVYRPSFTTERELWNRFVLVARENDMAAAQVLNRFIKEWIEANEK